jgi:hypothetical protein
LAFLDGRVWWPCEEPTDGGRVDFEQARSISGRFVALGNHPSDLGLLLR